MTNLSRIKRWLARVGICLTLVAMNSTCAWADGYVLLAGKQIGIQKIEAGDITRLLGLQSDTLNNSQVKLVIRSERDVSDNFLRTHINSTWFNYLDRVNKLFFQQRITSIPPILSLQEFLVNATFDPNLVTYLSEKELQGIKLPEGLTALPIANTATITDGSKK